MTVVAVFLDASYLLALYYEGDVHHKKARLIAEKINANEYGQTITTDDIFDEVVSVALRKLGKEKAKEFANQIIDSVFILNCDKHIFDNALKIFNSSNQPFSFTDCTTQAIIEFAQINYIATFDKQFEKIDIEVIN